MNNETNFSQSTGLQDEKKELLITPYLKEGQLPTFLEQAIKSGWGRFSDVIRNIFEHETISQARRRNANFTIH